MKIVRRLLFLLVPLGPSAYGKQPLSPADYRRMLGDIDEIVFAVSQTVRSSCEWTIRDGPSRWLNYRM